MSDVSSSQWCLGGLALLGNRLGWVAEEWLRQPLWSASGCVFNAGICSGSHTWCCQLVVVWVVDLSSGPGG